MMLESNYYYLYILHDILYGLLNSIINISPNNSIYIYIEDVYQLLYQVAKELHTI